MISLVENDLIVNARDGSAMPETAVAVPESVFEALRQLAFDTDSVEGLFTFFVRKGSEYIRVCRYVGLLTLPDGTQVEILPKIGRGPATRSVLLAMLRHLEHGPFRTLTSAHTNATHLPLWEVFVMAFLDALEPIMQQGIQRTYVAVESNERYWKGRFQATRQLRENAQHAERLAVRYDMLTADVPHNRILKTTLLFLQQRTKTTILQQRIRQLLCALDDVPVSESLPNDLQIINRLDRVFARYEPALRWAVALLGNRAYGVKPGRTADLSLLFPMERVFEDYVAYGVRRFWPEAGAVTVQESSAHLVDEHVGMPKFRLRPDLLIRHHDQTFVLDTKWKQINSREPGMTSAAGTYGIEQADLYQLYAYGKKYAASDLFLIYPASDTFQNPLPVFGYDAHTRLHVVPFDATNPLPHEVEKLAAYALANYQ